VQFHKFGRCACLDLDKSKDDCVYSWVSLAIKIQTVVCVTGECSVSFADARSELVNL
jgi:hypothetical protein